MPPVHSPRNHEKHNPDETLIHISAAGVNLRILDTVLEMVSRACK